MSFEFRSQLDKKTARIQSFWRRHTILISLHEKFSLNTHSATYSVSKPPSTHLYLSHINIPLSLASFPWVWPSSTHQDTLRMRSHFMIMPKWCYMLAILCTNTSPSSFRVRAQSWHGSSPWTSLPGSWSQGTVLHRMDVRSRWILDIVPSFNRHLKFF